MALAGAAAGVAQLVGTLSRTPKGWGFDSWSGHIPKLWVQYLVMVRMGGNQLMFLSLSLCLSLPSSLSKINKHIFLKKWLRR